MFRGKLSFLTTKDDRVKVLNERINLTEKHLIDVGTTFALDARKTARQRDACDEMARTIKCYAEEEEINDSMREGLKSFTNAATILADYADLKTQRLEAKIVNEFMQFDIFCKSTRDNLRAAVVARDKEVFKQRQMLEITTKFNSNNNAADSDLLKTQIEVNRANKEIDDIVSNFEKRKLALMKSSLMEYVLIAMRFHTKSLEALTATYYDVSNIDEQSDFQEFQKLIKSKTDAQTRKMTLKHELRRASQSMEELDREQLLSPIERRGIRKGNHKKLSSGKTDDEVDDDDDDDDEDEQDDSEDDEEQDEEEDENVSVCGSQDEEAENESYEEEIYESDEDVGLFDQQYEEEESHVDDSDENSNDDDDEVATGSNSEMDDDENEKRERKKSAKHLRKSKKSSPKNVFKTNNANNNKQNKNNNNTTFTIKKKQQAAAAKPFAVKGAASGGGGGGGAAVGGGVRAAGIGIQKSTHSGIAGSRLVTIVESKRKKQQEHGKEKDIIDCSTRGGGGGTAAGVQGRRE